MELQSSAGRGNIDDFKEVRSSSKFQSYAVYVGRVAKMAYRRRCTYLESRQCCCEQEIQSNKDTCSARRYQLG